jgi:hypothetical protein
MFVNTVMMTTRLCWPYDDCPIASVQLWLQTTVVFLDQLLTLLDVYSSCLNSILNVEAYFSSEYYDNNIVIMTVNKCSIVKQTYGGWIMINIMNIYAKIEKICTYQVKSVEIIVRKYITWYRH